MSSAAASFFSCTTCGALDEPACVDYNYPSSTTNTNSSPTSTALKSTNKTNSTASIASTDSQNSITSTTMRRVSSSRREQQSPVLMRSRSTERLGDGTPTTTTVAAVDDDGDLFQDASQNLAESTDNDSAAEVSSGDDDNDKAAVIPKHSQRSSTAAAKRAGYHVRAMSDPFDTQEMQDALQEETTTTAVVPPLEPAAGAYPTLLRFPVAETRNKNCWSEPPVTIFSVRGPQYFDDKKKQTSGPYLLSARGTDIFLFDTPVRLQDRSHLILGGHLRSVPTLLINFQFPWGVMVLYFEVPAKLAPYMCTNNTTSTTMNGNTNTTNPKKDASLSHSEKTLAAWFQGDENYKNDRLKLIPYVAEGPWVVRNMVTGRPAIIGRKLPVTYRAVPAHGHQAPLLEVTLDIGSSSATAKRIVSVCRRYMSGLSADIGFVIQAETAAELPEQMMGCVRVHGPDPLKAPKI